MQFSIMTSPIDFAGEQELIELMFEKSPFSLHINRFDNSEQKMERFLLSLPPEIRETAILHGNPELAESFSMGGFALKLSSFEKDNSFIENFKTLKKYVICENLEELGKIPSGLTNVIINPVYDSLTNPSLKSKLSLDFLLPENTGKKYVACGGVSEDEMEELAKKGFSSVIVCGSVWNYADPMVAFNRVSRMAFRLSQLL